MEELKPEYLGKYISILYRNGGAYISKNLEKSGLGSGQYIFLFSLLKRDGVNQEVLSNELFIDKGTTARALKKLEEEGFVERRICQTDKRANRIYVTDKARQIESEIVTCMKSWREVLLKEISEEDMMTTIRVLSQMVKNVELEKQKGRNY